MVTVRDIADRIGREEMAAGLGVGKTAVSNAVVRDRFPASWFLLVQEMCEARGLDCPPRLFGMRAHSQDVDKAPPRQGAAVAGR